MKIKTLQELKAEYLRKEKASIEIPKVISLTPEKTDNWYKAIMELSYSELNTSVS